MRMLAREAHGVWLRLQECTCTIHKYSILVHSHHTSLLALSFSITTTSRKMKTLFQCRLLLPLLVTLALVCMDAGRVHCSGSKEIKPQGHLHKRQDCSQTSAEDIDYVGADCYALLLRVIDGEYAVFNDFCSQCCEVVVAYLNICNDPAGADELHNACLTASIARVCDSVPPTNETMTESQPTITETEPTSTTAITDGALLTTMAVSTVLCVAKLAYLLCTIL